MINEEKFKDFFNQLTKFVVNHGWFGACHATIALLYSVCLKLGINCEPCIGEVVGNSKPFDHSWLLVDDEIYDIAIALPLNSIEQTGPIYKSIDLSTGKKCTIKYGIRFLGLDEQASWVSKQNIYAYLKNSTEMNLVKLICDIAGQCKIYITNKWLKENLSDKYWCIK